MVNSVIENFIDNNKDEPLFIVSKEKKFAFINISKNAITSLKYLVLKSKGLDNLQHNTIHRMIGHHPNYYNVEIDKILEYEQENNLKLIKFAVIRDPLDRLVSTYKLFWLDNFPHPYFSLMKKNFNIDTFDKFLYWVQNYELKKETLNQDEHIRKQCSWLKNINCLDYIVPINLLDHFIKNKLNINTIVKENVSKNNFVVTQEQEKIIKNIYADDYKFIGQLNINLIYKKK